MTWVEPTDADLDTAHENGYDACARAVKEFLVDRFSFSDSDADDIADRAGTIHAEASVERLLDSRNDEPAIEDDR